MSEDQINYNFFSEPCLTDKNVGRGEEFPGEQVKKLTFKKKEILPSNDINIYAEVCDKKVHSQIKKLDKVCIYSSKNE